MLDNILPIDIMSAIKKIPYESICELRLRANNPIVINVVGENKYLDYSGLSSSASNSIKATYGQLQGIIQKISNNSMYTINDQLIDGYVTISGGIRVGECGEVVSVAGIIKTIKNISSLNFRFPHFVRNCSLKILPYIYRNNNLKSTLIVSPPGAGKTTYLRDLIYQLTNRDEILNVLVVDERQELSRIFDGNRVVSLDNVDVCLNSTKTFGFTNGIRSMKPDVIFTDEINIDKDLDIIESALTSGVKVIASLHASNTQDLRNKSSFKQLLDKQLFERYVFLSNENGIGTLEGVFDENLNLLGV